MGSIFGRFIEVDEKPFPWEDHAEDILQYAMDDIAQDVQYRVRSRLDNGFDLRSAIRARTVTVRNEFGNLIIKSADAEGSEDNTTIQDLLETHTVDPKIEGNQIIFRKIRESQIKGRNISAIDNAFRDSMSLQFGNKLEGATQKVIAENPELLR